MVSHFNISPLFSFVIILRKLDTSLSPCHLTLMTNTPASIMRYVEKTPDQHWLWHGPLSCPRPRVGLSGRYVVNFQPRPEIHLLNKKTTPQRVFFTELYGIPPPSRLQRLRELCSLDLCVNPHHFHPPCPTAFLEPLTHDHVELLAMLSLDEPYNAERFQGFEEELLLIGKHYPHIVEWMNR